MRSWWIGSKKGEPLLSAKPISHSPLETTSHSTMFTTYLTSNNPYDLMRTPGGSTGGGAAATAAGIGFLTFGSDIAGSIRLPAHFCGLYGHKPTIGLVPK